MVKSCEGSYRQEVSDYAALIRPEVGYSLRQACCTAKTLSVSRTDPRRKADLSLADPSAVECGFLLVRRPDDWSNNPDLAIEEAWIVAPVIEPYPVSQTCTVSPLAHFLQYQAKRF